jgi:hypothetical protein
MSKLKGILIFAVLACVTTAVTLLAFSGSDEAADQTQDPQAKTISEKSPEAKRSTKPAQPPTPKPVNLDGVRNLLATGRLYEARDEMARIYAAELTADSTRDELEPMMLKLSQTLIIEKPTERDFDFYRVQSGDSLIKIAKHYRNNKDFPHVQFGLLKMFNKLGKNLIRVNQRLRIPRGEISIVVRKSTFKLYVFYKGIAFASFDCAIGAEASATPAGTYAVADKTAKPTWWPPESTGLTGPISADDPKNPLGSHWIALDHDLHCGIGIHGTNDPASIGSQASLGCIRMRNHEVKVIFELATPGIEVTIRN